MGQMPRQPERPKGSKDEMAPARCQARKAPRLLVSKLNVFLLLLLKTQTNIKEPYSPKAHFMFAQHLIFKRNFKRHFLGIPIVGGLSKAEWATSAMPEDVMIL